MHLQSRFVKNIQSMEVSEFMSILNCCKKRQSVQKVVLIYVAAFILAFLVVPLS